MAVPLLIGVDDAIDPEPLPDLGLPDRQVATVLGVVLLVLLGWLLLLAYLLLRRSRIAWLFTVATAVSGTAGPSGLTSVPVDVVGRALGLATWLPLLTPSALRWFWRRPRVSDWSYGTSVPDLRRSD
jgi:hypothetical protein